MKCGYQKCEKVRGKDADDSVMDQGIMRDGIWYCSHSHYEEQAKLDWRQDTSKIKCRNLHCVNMRPTGFWDKLKKGEGIEKDGNWYCSPKCYEEDVKRAWIDERERYLSQNLDGRIHKIRFGALLMQEDVITPEQLDNALAMSKRTKQRVGESLLELGYITEDQLTKILSRQEGIPKIDLSRTTLKPEVINLINKSQAKKYKALPIEVLKKTNTLILAISDPTDKLSLIDLKYITGFTVEPFIVQNSSLKSALKRYYKLTDKDFDSVKIKKAKKVKTEKVTKTKESQLSKEELVELKNAVNVVLSGAKEKGASDFDLFVDGDTIKGHFSYGSVRCTIEFKKTPKP